MGWWTDGEGARGFFSDDLNVPVGWTAIPAPDALPDPLDHDGDGRKGGSLSGKRATARKRK
jgi:hypothetical protein